MSLPLSILLGGNMLIKKIKTYKWHALASLMMTGVVGAGRALATTLFARGVRGFVGRTK